MEYPSPEPETSVNRVREYDRYGLSGRQRVRDVGRDRRTIEKDVNDDNIVVKAEYIHKEHYYKVRNRENICKIKITNEEGNIYYIELTPNCEFWKINNKYFQDNFNKFCDIVNETLILEKGDIKHKIIKEDFETLTLNLIYGGLFGFEISIEIPRKKDRIDLIDNEVQDILKQNEEKDKIIEDLEKRVDYLERLIKMNLELRKYHDGPFVDFPTEENTYHWVNREAIIKKNDGSEYKINYKLFPANFKHYFNISGCQVGEQFRHIMYNCDLNSGICDNKSLCKSGYGFITINNGGIKFNEEYWTSTCLDEKGCSNTYQLSRSMTTNPGIFVADFLYEWIQFVQKWIK
jgi:hypothetical protein